MKSAHNGTEHTIWLNATSEAFWTDVVCIIEQRYFFAQHTISIKNQIQPSSLYSRYTHSSVVGRAKAKQDNNNKKHSQIFNNNVYRVGNNNNTIELFFLNSRLLKTDVYERECCFVHSGSVTLKLINF